MQHRRDNSDGLGDQRISWGTTERYGTEEFMGGGTTVHTRVKCSPTVSQIHDHVQLGVHRDSGKCDTGEAGGSWQGVSDRKGILCEMMGARW